jgi:surface antigen
MDKMSGEATGRHIAATSLTQRWQSSNPHVPEIVPASMTSRLFSTILLLSGLGLALSSCAATTSGSQRLDETGNRIAESGMVEPDAAPTNSAGYIAALKGGIISRAAGLNLGASDRSRALEAEYRALENAPSGQIIAWSGSKGVGGQVTAAAPYQVGQQNCRQYSHNLTNAAGRSFLARGAACRNPNGTWTPLI